MAFAQHQRLQARCYWRTVLALSGSAARAAILASCNRSTVYELCKRYGVALDWRGTMPIVPAQWPESWAAYRRRSAREYLAALLAYEGKRTRAAQLAGVSRGTLYKLLRRCDLPIRARRRGAWDRPIPGDTWDYSRMPVRRASTDRTARGLTS